MKRKSSVTVQRCPRSFARLSYSITSARNHQSSFQNLNLETIICLTLISLESQRNEVFIVCYFNKLYMEFTFFAVCLPSFAFATRARRGSSRSSAVITCSANHDSDSFRFQMTAITTLESRNKARPSRPRNRSANSRVEMENYDLALSDMIL
jgi:hypothetical protein